MKDDESSLVESSDANGRFEIRRRNDPSCHLKRKTYGELHLYQERSRIATNNLRRSWPDAVYHNYSSFIDPSPRTIA